MLRRAGPVFRGATVTPTGRFPAVAILRTDQELYWRRLNGWDLHLGTAPDVVTPWPARTVVPEPLYAVWCREEPDSQWAFEILLNDSDVADWLFRRDHRVRFPLRDLSARTPEGISFLAPEIVLLYKAKNLRDHDVQDFERARPALSDPQRRWLADATRHRASRPRVAASPPKGLRVMA